MQTFVTVIHVLTCIFLILVILPQSGKGADISASFGGSSQTIFGSSGGATFITRTTAILAAIFFMTSLALTAIRTHSRKSLFSGSAAATSTATAPVQTETKTDAQAPASTAATGAATTTPAQPEAKK